MKQKKNEKYTRSVLLISILSISGCAKNSNLVSINDKQHQKFSVQQSRNNYALEFFIEKNSTKPSKKTMYASNYDVDIYRSHLTINYEVGSHYVDDHDKIKIKNLLYREKIKSIRIEGYTDDTGSREFNLNLAKMRAMKVKKYIESITDDDKKIYLDYFGKCCYLNKNASKNERRENRRVVIYFS